MQAQSILEAKGNAVITTRPETVVAEAIGLMVREKIGALLVCEANQVIVGIVTERDVLHGLVEHGSELLERRVADLMSRDVITASLDDDAGTLMTVMTEHRCRHIPVTENNVLCGLISIGDLVKNRLREMEQDTSQMRDYIAHG